MKIDVQFTDNKIYFYDECIYVDNYKELDVVKSYKIVVNIDGFTNKKLYRISRINNRVSRNNCKSNYLSTKLIIVDTFKLSDYCHLVGYPAFYFNVDKNEKWLEFDYEKFIKDKDAKTYKYILDRYNRYFNTKNIIPVLYTETEYYNGREFLEFTPETAINWAGPFSQNGKLGCVMSSRESEMPYQYPKSLEYRWAASYSVNESIKNKLVKEFGNEWEMFLYKNPDKQYSFFYKKMTGIEREYVISKSWFFKKEEIPEYRKYVLRLSGNDDCSYSKCFNTKRELNNEIDYLRRMQPLDMNYDIYDRGYIFTN